MLLVTLIIFMKLLNKNIIKNKNGNRTDTKMKWLDLLSITK